MLRYPVFKHTPLTCTPPFCAPRHFIARNATVLHLHLHLHDRHTLHYTLALLCCVSGPKPLLLLSPTFSDLCLLLHGNQQEDTHIEFGAHQVHSRFKNCLIVLRGALCEGGEGGS
jgi:hypothetical protein